jgi:hypothetical protein
LQSSGRKEGRDENRIEEGRTGIKREMIVEEEKHEGTGRE